MEFEEVINKVNSALDELYDKQNDLFENNVNEVTINIHLVQYLSKFFSEYNVDAEYNRERVIASGIIRPKRMLNGDGTKNLFKPDIIIHKRNSTGPSNLVAIESKKQWNKDREQRQKDLQVLCNMTRGPLETYEIDEKEEYFGYPYGLFIDYGKTRNKVIIKRIKNGTMKLERKNFNRKYL
jgi:hypothetical protein